MLMKQLIGFLLFSGVLAGTTTGFAQSGNVVKYRATMKDVKYVYGVAEPVAHLKLGDILNKQRGCFRQRDPEAGRLIIW